MSIVKSVWPRKSREQRERAPTVRIDFLVVSAKEGGGGNKAGKRECTHTHAPCVPSVHTTRTHTHIRPQSSSHPNPNNPRAFSLAPTHTHTHTPLNNKTLPLAFSSWTQGMTTTTTTTTREDLWIVIVINDLKNTGEGSKGVSVSV